VEEAIVWDNVLSVLEQDVHFGTIDALICEANDMTF
jgi:hypothetical protein